MKCRECGGDAGHHEPECKWGRDVAPKYFDVLNTLSIYHGSGDVEALRTASDKLSVLTAWASAYEIENASAKSA